MRLLKKYCKSVFTLDTRSLAAFRIGIACILIYEVFFQWKYSDVFLSPTGAVPLKALLTTHHSQWSWSLYYISTGLWWAKTLLLLQWIFSFTLLIGYRTKLSTFISWVLLVSLHTRLPSPLQSGDVLLRLLLFWSYFLPLGQNYSIDSVLKPVLQNKQKIYNVASAALILQALLVYVFSALFKTGSDWQITGDAIYYALNIDHFATSLGKWMLTWPIEYLRYLTRFVYHYELIAPFLLLLIPIPIFRLILLSGFWMMHLAFGATLAIGNFFWISILSTIPMTPSFVWNKLSLKLRPRENLKIYYDGNCGFCTQSIQILSTFLFLPLESFTPAQTDTEILKHMTEHNSTVVKRQEALYYRTEAFFYIIKSSPMFFPFFYLKYVPGFITFGDIFYQWIADHRKQTCQGSSREHIFSNKKEIYFIAQGFCAISLVFVLAWNWHQLPDHRNTNIAKLAPFMILFRLDQKWNMFSPNPLKTDGWFIFRGFTINNEYINLMEPSVQWNEYKPPDLHEFYPNFRWRKYILNFYEAKTFVWKKYFLKYLCSQWNQNRPYNQYLRRIELLYMKQRTPPPGLTLPEAQEELLYTQSCGYYPIYRSQDRAKTDRNHK